MASYECVFCGRKFKVYRYLENHIGGHTLERPYPCLPCDLWFRSPQALWQHKFSVHAGKKFKCDFCESSFNHRSNMCHHRRRAHPEENEKLIQSRMVESAAYQNVKTKVKTLPVPKPKLSSKTIKTDKQISSLPKSPEKPKTGRDKPLNNTQIMTGIEKSPPAVVYPHEINNHVAYFQAMTPSLVLPFFLFPTQKPKTVQDKVAPFKLFKFKEMSQSEESCESESESQKSPTIPSQSQESSSSEDDDDDDDGNESEENNDIFKPAKSTTARSSVVSRNTAKQKFGNNSKLKSKECPICRQNFTQRGNMIRHIRRRHPKHPFARKPHLILHFQAKKSVIQSHSHRTKTKPQPTAPEIGTSKPTKTAQDKFPCQICGKPFSSQFALDRHVYRTGGCKWKIVENEPPQLLKKTPPVKLKTPTNPKATATIKQIVKNVPPPRSKSKPPASNSGKGIMYKCYKCVLVCSRRENLKRHLKTVHAGCPVKIITIATAKTSQMPTDKTGISSRATISSKQGAFKCPHCNVMFNWQKNLARHVRDQHPNLPVVNSRPVNIKSGRGPFPCSFCDAKYNSRKTLQEHVRDQHDPLDKEKEGGTRGRRVPGKDGRWAFQCSYCDAKCNWRRNLAKHVRDLHPDGSTTNKPPRPFQCSYCDATYTLRHSLIRHVREHHPEVDVDTDPSCLPVKKEAVPERGTFKCSYCSAKFIWMRNLRQHVRERHKNVEKASDAGCRPVKNQNGPGTFPCGYCDAKYSWRKDLRKHIRILHPEVDGETESPNSTQAVSSNFGEISRETIADTGDDCGALQDLPAINLDLKGTPIVADRPKTSGTGKRKETRGVYPCKHCGEKYSWRKNLIRHVRKQHPEKDAMDIDAHEKFECSHCNAKYMWRKHLLVHVRKHHSNVVQEAVSRIQESMPKNLVAGKTGPGSFQCTFCEAKYIWLRSLQRHVQKHHQKSDKARKKKEKDSQVIKESTPKSSVKSKNTPGTFQCSSCPAKYKLRTNLLRHIREQHGNVDNVSTASCRLVKSPQGPGVFKCNHCESKYTWRKDLKKHVQQLHPEVQTERDPIKIVLSMKAAAKSKKTVAISEKVKKFPVKPEVAKSPEKFKSTEDPCQKCGKVFPTTRRLLAHWNSNPDCDKQAVPASTDCPGDSATGSTSEKGDNSDSFHAVPMETEGANVSSLCDAASTLSASEPEPTGPKLDIVDKPDSKKNDPNGFYPCPNCGKVLKTIWSMQRHVRMNSCEFSTQRDALLKLNATLDFICIFCNEDLKDRSALMRHVAGKHKFVHENASYFRDADAAAQRGVYFCPFCGLTENTRDTMLEHFKQNHWHQFGVPKGSRRPVAPAAAAAVNNAPGEEEKRLKVTS